MSMKEVQTQLTLAPGATVVLSACNTGRGKIMGEGVVGLSRGFLFAGAGAVISSLWSVHDESTKELMSVFYSHFSAGRRAPEAMRCAMLQLIHAQPKGIFTHPYYWSAFIVTGASTSIRGWLHWDIVHTYTHTHETLYIRTNKQTNIQTCTQKTLSMSSFFFSLSYSLAEVWCSRR